MPETYWRIIISLVIDNTPKRRRVPFVQILMNDNVASVTSIERDICGKVLEKHRIKRDDSFMISKILPLDQEITQKDAKRLACAPSSLILAKHLCAHQ